jgi:hypothetical protein
MGEDAGVMHGRGHPLVLLCEVGVVRNVLADSILLLSRVLTWVMRFMIPHMIEFS